MKGFMNFTVTALLLAIPLAAECRTVAYGPSIPGQPLIFHVNTSFNQASQFSAVSWTQIENALLIRSSYSQHLENSTNRFCCEQWNEGNCCEQWNIWADALGQWQHQNSTHQHQLGYNDKTGGLTVGADTCYNDFIVGAAFSYTNSNLRWKRSAGHSQINSYYGGLYGSWNNECLYVNASVLGAYSDYHTSRHFHRGTIDRHAHARHKSGEALAGIEAGVMMQELFCGIDLIPFVGFDYVYLSQQGYSEHDADRFNLHIKRRNDQLLQSEIGLQFTRCFQWELCCKNWTIAPNVFLSYTNQTSLTGRSYHTHFVGHDHGFSVKGWRFDRNLGAIGLNFNFLDCTDSMNFTLHYDGQFGKNYWNQTGSIMCNLCF
jgi:outer membrane autotransporter protein